MKIWKRVAIILFAVVIFCMLGVLLYKNISYQNNAVAFIRDYIRFLNELAMVKDIGSSDDDDFTNFITENKVRHKQAINYLKPYCNNKSIEIKRISTNLIDNVNDLIMSEEKITSFSQQYTRDEIIENCDKYIGFSNILMDNIRLEMWVILEFITKGKINRITYSKEFYKCRLNKKQLLLILSDIDHYFGYQLKNLGIKNKEFKEIMKMSLPGYIWPVVILKQYAIGFRRLR